MGKDGALYAQLLYPSERAVEMGMGGMRPATQAIDDPQIAASDPTSTFLGYLVEIGGIADTLPLPFKTESPRRDIAVNLREGRDLYIADSQASRAKAVRPRGGFIPLPPLKDIFETIVEVVLGARLSVAFHWPPHQMEELTKVVDTMGMIGMAVCNQYRIEVADVRIQHLFPKIGTGIHQYIGLVSLDEDRYAAAAITGFCRIAGAPVIANSGDTGGGAAPQHRDLHAGAAFVNNL